MNKILILTTEGCEGCYIAKQNVELAILRTSKDITVESKDWHNCPKNIIVKHKIKDFPAVLYYVDDKVVNKAIGSYPVAVYVRWIDMYFKN